MDTNGLIKVNKWNINSTKGLQGYVDLINKNRFTNPTGHGSCYMCFGEKILYAKTPDRLHPYPAGCAVTEHVIVCRACDAKGFISIERIMAILDGYGDVELGKTINITTADNGTTNHR